MNRLLIILLATLLCSFSIRNLHVVSPSADDAPEYMTRVAGKVLNDLKQAKGILPHEPPRLIVKEFLGTDRLGRMVFEEGIIELQDEAYKRCAELEADSLNALAWILGHELGHYIHKHSAINHNIDHVGTVITRDADVVEILETVVGIKEAASEANILIDSISRSIIDETHFEDHSEERDTLLKTYAELIKGLKYFSMLDSIIQVADDQLRKVNRDRVFGQFLRDSKNTKLSSALKLLVRIRGTSGFDRQARKRIANFVKRLNEAEADFEGAFLGYLAGYQPVDAGKSFLRKAYNHRKTKPSSSRLDYPSLADRLEILESTKTDLDTLVPLFEMSQYLAAIGQYEDAIPYLETILTKFQSREIYNNIGVMLLLETKRLFPDSIFKYNFPLTLDARFRAPHPARENGAFMEADEQAIIGAFNVFDLDHCQVSEAQKQIEQSEYYFKKAIDLNPEYALSYLNLSVAQTIKAILFDFREGDLHPNYPLFICFQDKNDALTEAIANAQRARELTEIALASGNFSLECFDVIPSETTTLVSANRKRLPIFGTALRMNVDSMTMFDSTTMTENTVTITTIDTIRSVYPYRKEFFNREDWFIQSSSTSGKALHTRWFSNQGLLSGIPDNGVLLSNIHVQIDLVRIYQNSLIQNKLKVKNRTGSELTLEPFTQALEIHPSNSLALENLRRFNGDTSDESQTSSIDSICTIDQFYDKIPTDVFTALSDANDWDYSRILSKSVLMAHYGQRTASLGNSFHSGVVAMRNYFKLVQTIQIKDDSSHMFFVNNSERADGRRLERTIVLVPKRPEMVATNCPVKMGSSLEDIESIFGSSSQKLLLTNGNLVIYHTSESGGFIPGDDHANPADPESDLDNISTTVNIIEGVILKVNNQNKISGWALFNRFVETRKDPG